jgi:hypothetical protein
MAELAIDSNDAFTVEAAYRALTRACQLVELHATEADLIRLGSNAVLRLDAETIACVAPSLAR